MTAFALAAALHAGFQVTVTVLVYPALVEVGDDVWSQAHDRHSRRVVGLVGVVYAVLLGTGALAVVQAPCPGPWGRTALGLTGSALVLTALSAAPLHGQLGVAPSDRRPALLRRLLLADRARCGCAVAGAVAAAVTVLG